MNDTDDQIIQTRIAASLEHRRQLAPALAAFAQELPPSRSRRELRHLANQLRAAATAEEIFASTTRNPSSGSSYERSWTSSFNRLSRSVCGSSPRALFLQNSLRSNSSGFVSVFLLDSRAADDARS